MAFRAYEVSLGTTPSVVFQAQPSDLEVWVEPTNTGTRLGGPDVTRTGNGSGASFQSEVRPGDEVWGVLDSGTSNLRTVNVRVRSAE